MSIAILYAAIVVAIWLIACACLLSLLGWLADVVESRYRRRHAAKRRARARGYLPIYDQEYEPQRLLDAHNQMTAMESIEWRP